MQKIHRMQIQKWYQEAGLWAEQGQNQGGLTADTQYLHDKTAPWHTHFIELSCLLDLRLGLGLGLGWC